jgi:hypothetical protein
MTVQEILDSDMTYEEMDEITGTSAEIEKAKIAQAKKATP